MQRSGGVVTLMKSINVTYLSGQPIQKNEPLQPYNETVCEFLGELSRVLQQKHEAQSYPDVISFAFFCRRANIKRLKSEFEDGKIRMGRGIIFHIAPSNVPINFAFSYVFGLLAGNANIVRVSAAKKFPQTDIICGAMNKLFEKEQYRVIKEHTAIISYERSQDITDKLSAMANVRVIWGGNSTISDIRRSPIGSRCTEITFADRFSFGIINAQSILDSSDEDLNKLSGKFYNDTYLMDQNACSTPHLIIWDCTNCMDIRKAKNKFWKFVFDMAHKYDLADIKVSDKYVMACEYAVNFAEKAEFYKYENYLYIYNLKELPEKITGLRGKFGLFFEYEISNIDELAGFIDESVQTCVYYGMDRKELVNFVLNNHLTGIDRIVPVGSSLDIGPYWDGYNIISNLSRIIGE